MLHLYEGESSETRYSFSVRGKYGNVGFANEAYNALFPLYEKGAIILAKKISDYNSHFLVYDLVYKRFILNNQDFEEEIKELARFYDDLESCSAIVPIFGIKLGSEEILIGDIKIIDREAAFLKIDRLSSYSRFNNKELGDATPARISLDLIGVRAFVEVEHSESLEVIGRTVRNKLDKLLPLFSLLRRGWVVPDFGVGVNRFSQTYPAIAFSKNSGSGNVVDFLSAWSDQLEISQEIIDKSIIPQIYSMLVKNDPTKLEKAICLASELLANSKDQYDRGNSYICLSIALECLYSSPSDDVRTITSAIAEGVAYSLGKDADHRKTLYSAAKKIYNLRSRVAHGEARDIDRSKVSELYEIVEGCLKYFISKSGEWKDKTDFIGHIENLKFGLQQT